MSFKNTCIRLTFELYMTRYFYNFLSDELYHFRMRSKEESVPHDSLMEAAYFYATNISYEDPASTIFHLRIRIRFTLRCVLTIIIGPSSWFSSWLTARQRRRSRSYYPHLSAIYRTWLYLSCPISLLMLENLFAVSCAIKFLDVIIRKSTRDGNENGDVNGTRDIYICIIL